MFLMTFGAVILFDDVATLGGGVFTTLGGGATTLGADVPVLTVGINQYAPSDTQVSVVRLRWILNPE